MEEIAEAGGDGPRWYQLYWPNDDELAASLVRRAEAAGYGAIVVTVNTFIPGWKPRDLQQAWLPFLQGVGNANYFADPVFRGRPRASRPRRTSVPQSGTTSACTVEPVAPRGTTSPACASGPRCRS